MIGGGERKKKKKKIGTWQETAEIFNMVCREPDRTVLNDDGSFWCRDIVFGEK